MDELQSNFENEASETIKIPANYARNFLEYSCLRALGLATHITGHLADKSFRRLTFDMMLAWEIPSSSTQSVAKVLANYSSCWYSVCRILQDALCFFIPQYITTMFSPYLQMQQKISCY